MPPPPPCSPASWDGAHCSSVHHPRKPAGTTRESRAQLFRFIEPMILHTTDSTLRPGQLPLSTHTYTHTYTYIHLHLKCLFLSVLVTPLLPDTSMIGIWRWRKRWTTGCSPALEIRAPPPPPPPRFAVPTSDCTSSTTVSFCGRQSSPWFRREVEARPCCWLALPPAYCSTSSELGKGPIPMLPIRMAETDYITRRGARPGTSSAPAARVCHGPPVQK